MFTEDSRTENFLTSLGVKYAYTNGVLLPADFAPGWDTDNLGRPVAVREDAVIEYATLMEAGSAAPAPIVCKSPDGLHVLDGVQRLSAAALRQTTRVSVYLVDTDSEDSLAAIRVLANARLQGRAEPPEWTRRRAVEVLVVARGMSHLEVAHMGGWKPADIKRISEAITLQLRIRNVEGPELSDAMLAEIMPHVQHNELLEKATAPLVGFMQVLKQSRISVADAAEYLNTFFRPLPKAANPFNVYSERLREVHDDPEIKTRVTGRQHTELPKDVVLLRALKSVETVLDSIVANNERVNNVDEFFRLIDRITRKLKQIAPNKQRQASRVPADMWTANK
jgi:hypothetical protein